MRNVKLELCYEGTRYKGWQRLPGEQNTLQGKLETALGRILGEPVEVIGSGRTDAGTHAMGQVCNFHCESQMPCEEILSALRQYLPEDVGIYSCRNVSPRFHARLNAKEKTYRYRIWNSGAPCVFQRKFVYILQENLDFDAMQEAAQYFLGTHDFSAFCANKNMKKSTVRHIERITLEKVVEELQITVTGNGFLHHMVRIMVGTLIEVGRGERSASSIPELFGAERSQAGYLVPASGLCLMEVTY